MKEILKYIIWVGVCATLVIPFIVSNSLFFPYITGKVFTFRIIVEIIFGLWLILILKDSKFRPKWSWVLGAVGLFTLVLLIADINAVAPFKAFWSNFERMEGFVLFAHLLAYFLVVGSVLNKENLWLWFLRFNLLAGSVLAITSIAEGAKENIVRIAGPLGNPIYISVYFLFIFFFSLIVLYKDVLVRNLSDWNIFKKVFKNILFYIYIALSILSLYVVYRTSRGALLGLIGGVFVTAVLIAIFEKEKKVIRRIALGGIVTVLVVIVGFFAVRDTQYVKDNSTLSRFAEISWTNVSGQARQLVWPMALKGFKEKPLLGWGQEGFNYVFNKYYDPKMYGQESWFDRAHNAPLDFLVASGLIGFISYSFLFLSALYLLWFRKNNLDITERSILTGVFLGYLFQAIFVFDNLISYVLFFTTLAYVHSRITEDIAKESKQKPGYLSSFFQNEEYQNYIVIPVIVILTVTGVWWINVPSIKANQTLIQALRSIQNKNITVALEYFKKALSYQSMGDSEIREQLLSYTPAIVKASDINKDLKKQFLTLTLNEIEKQINKVPNDARYHILAGSLLNNIGNPEQAILYIKKAIELSPQKQAMRFELIQSLYSLGKSREAMLEAKSAYELDKNYEQAKQIYVATIQNEIKVNPAFRLEGEKMLKELSVGE
jgi:O-antigen ligase